MRTVKEFKEAGLVFVEGDICKNDHGQTINDGAPSIAAGYGGGLTPVKFAWRKNTGEKPSFSGAVEVVYSGDFKEVFPVDRLNWVANDEDYEIIKWRPVITKEDKMEVESRGFHSYQKLVDWNEGGYLSFGPDATDQDALKFEWQLTDEDKMEGKASDPKANERVEIPECAPTYTKEMHEAGEFKNGDKVYYQHLPDRQYIFIGKHPGGSGEYSVCYCNGNVATIMTKYLSAKPIDTRTDEEKLIDDIVDQVKNGGDMSYEEAIERAVKMALKEVGA